jgi:hypothetical protein
MILKDLITDVLDIAQDSEIGKFISRKNPTIKSITRSNKDLTMIFPVIASSSIEPKSAQLVTRALERKFTTLTQMLLSALSITSSKDAVEHLRNIHTNLDLDSFFDVDGYLTATEAASLDPLYFRDKLGEKMVHESYKRERLFGKPLNALTEANRTQVIRNRHLAQEANRNDSTKTVVTTKDPQPMVAGKMTFPTLMSNNDVKKANELQPTVVEIKFISTATGEPIDANAFIGIKTKLYAADSMDIINHVISKRVNKLSLYNLIKATSGEIEFWRDFIFALKKAKVDAISSTRRGSTSKLWKVLERRSIASKLNHLLSSRNDATAITTLAISMYEVEYLRKNEDIDLLDSRVARQLLDEYNLIGIAVVDDSTESVRFIFDTGDDEYEVYSFGSLKKEDKVDYKQMIQILAGGR